MFWYHTTWSDTIDVIRSTGWRDTRYMLWLYANQKQTEAN